MSESRLEAEKLLRQMNEEDQKRAFTTFVKIKLAKSEGEIDFLLKNASSQVQEFVYLMMCSLLENDVMKIKKEKLKHNASLIRKDAIALLPSLIAANPGVSDVELVERALAMAQRLHDFC